MEFKLDLGKRTDPTSYKAMEPQALFDAFEFLADTSKECLFIVGLTSRYDIIQCNLVTIGTASKIITSPREIFRPLIESNACAFVMIHNHPSGDPVPGEDDDRITEQMGKCGELMEIPMIDHIIIGKGKYWSHRETEASCTTASDVDTKDLNQPAPSAEESL